jgi:hypothetical protein
MRKWYIALFALACVAFVFVTMRLTRTDEGPVYRGHPLSYWLVFGQAHPEDETAGEAIRNAGTNALPFLLKWIRYEQPPWKVKVLNATPRRLAAPVWRLATSHREILASQSANAFCDLGTNATSAVPELTALARNTNAPQTSVYALYALAWIGPDGLASLVPLIQDRRYPLRAFAVAAISTTPTNAPGTTIIGPALIECLADTTDPRIPVTALMWLDRSRFEPAVSIPAIAASLINPLSSEDLRCGALYALATYGAQAASVLPTITNAQADPSTRVRTAATNAIRDITAAIATNSPPH